jgi:hypothetical protein
MSRDRRLQFGSGGQEEGKAFKWFGKSWRAEPATNPSRAREGGRRSLWNARCSTRLSRRVQDLPHHREIFEAPIAAPERFDARFAVAPPRQKTPELGNPAHRGA